eukprot:7387070-Prymnesium_polylepis.1
MEPFCATLPAMPTDEADTSTADAASLLLQVLSAAHLAPNPERVAEETLWAFHGLLQASAGGHAVLQSTSVLPRIVAVLVKHAYATSPSIDRDAFDVRRLAIMFIKHVTFGKGQYGDTLPGVQCYYPHDHRPMLDAGLLEQRKSLT